MLRRTMVHALLIAASCGLGACGTPAVRSDRMAPAPARITEFATGSPLRGSISLKDIGGGEPDTEDSNVGDDQLRQTRAHAGDGPQPSHPRVGFAQCVELPIEFDDAPAEFVQVLQLHLQVPAPQFLRRRALAQRLG